MVVTPLKLGSKMTPRLRAEEEAVIWEPSKVMMRLSSKILRKKNLAHFEQIILKIMKA